ncbi:MAG: WhiB family transcriptional regulator [Pseudonocardiaceae bacterium]
MITIGHLAPAVQTAGQQPACWGVDPEMFFGPADGSAGRPLHIWERRALAVCAGCPVAAACLAAALDFPATDQYGVVGGMTAGQRRALLRGRRSRRGGRNGLPWRGERRPIRGSGPAVAPAAGVAQRGPWPARP